jgi:hypothetical protein
MRRSLIRTSALALGIAASSLTVAPALAGTNATSSHYESGNANCPDNLRNRAKFLHLSDDVQSVDDCSDGWGAESELLLNNGVYRLCYNGGGNGTTKTCYYDFAENVYGNLLARSVDNGDFRGSGNVVGFYT